MRTVRLASASLSGRPKFCSSNVFRNSGPTGSGISSATIFRPVAKAWPAFSARAIRSSASGNASSKARSRRVRLTLRNMNGSAKPGAPPTGSAYFDRAIMPTISAIRRGQPDGDQEDAAQRHLEFVASIDLPRADPLVVPRTPQTKLLVKVANEGPLPAVDRILAGTTRGSGLARWIDPTGIKVSLSGVLLIALGVAALMALVAGISRDRVRAAGRRRGRLRAPVRISQLQADAPAPRLRRAVPGGPRPDSRAPRPATPSPPG